MFEKLTRVFRVKELRDKILFVLGVFVVFRVMANIPIPGIDAQRMREFLEGFQVFGLLNVFTGGALDNLSIMMLGLGPYITSTIVIQLLTMIFPALEKLYKEEGEAGRQKINQYGRLLAVPFAFLQGYAMLILLQRQGVIVDLSWSLLFSSVLTATAGTIFLMWLGEIITEKGIGNGVSLLIFAGIIAALPNHVLQFVSSYDPSQIISYAFFLALAILIIAAVVIVNDARRNIPISYAKRVRGMKMYGGASTYLPLSINPAGVIPIIFALSIMMFPGMIADFFAGSDGAVGRIAQSVGIFFQNSWVHGILYFLLIVLFTYFYTAVTFDPKSISQNLQKTGGFIPGIRPGEPTANFMYYILNRVLLVGALFLGVVAITPSVAAGVTGVRAFSFLVGGTSLLIVVSVILETIRQINAELQMRDYEKF